jgi:peptide chain release factor 3
VQDSASQTPLLAAVGPLQFEVVQYRLQSEYGANTRLAPAPWGVLRWVAPGTNVESLEGTLPSGSAIAADVLEQPVVLFPSEWALGYFQKQNKDVVLSDAPFARRA